MFPHFERALKEYYFFKKPEKHTEYGVGQMLKFVKKGKLTELDFISAYFFETQDGY